MFSFNNIVIWPWETMPVKFKLWTKSVLEIVQEATAAAPLPNSQCTLLHKISIWYLFPTDFFFFLVCLPQCNWTVSINLFRWDSFGTRSRLMPCQCHASAVQLRGRWIGGHRGIKLGGMGSCLLQKSSTFLFGSEFSSARMRYLYGQGFLAVRGLNVEVKLVVSAFCNLAFEVR